MAFKCPVCKKSTKVTDTRGNERRRVCECGNVFRTYEAVVGESLRTKNRELKILLENIKSETLKGL